jgi:hypothetical protein
MADDEADFQRWYAGVAGKLNAKKRTLDPNPDSPEHHYDYRGFYRGVKAGTEKPPTQPGGHFSSAFKTEGHPRSHLQDSLGKVFDTRSAKYLTGEQVPQRELLASERSPDMPGFDAEKAKTLIPSLMAAAMAKR